jgi:hypothetical protein
VGANLPPDARDVQIVDPAAMGEHWSDHAGGCQVNAVRIVAIVLIAAGVLGLVYGGFSYTRETHEAKLGPIELEVKEKQTVNIPVWAGVGAIAIGSVQLLLGGRKG